MFKPFLVISLIILIGCTQKVIHIDDLTPVFDETACKTLDNHGTCKPMLVQAIHDNDLARVREIIRMGEDVNTVYAYYYGMTPLMEAVASNRAEIALWLLDNGADPHITMPLDPLKEAEANGMARVAERIRQLRNTSK